MLNITTEPTRPNAEAETAPPKASLKRYVLEKLRTWVNSLLEAERDEFLGRGRHQPLDPATIITATGTGHGGSTCSG